MKIKTLKAKTRTQINRDGTARRTAELEQRAFGAGWYSLSEYLTAVRAGIAQIPAPSADWLAERERRRANPL